MNSMHPGLSAGGWGRLDLMQQLGNVGSEVSRAQIWQSKDPEAYRLAMMRALELLDLTIGDPRWRGRIKEIARAREMLCDAWLGGREFGNDLAGMNRYFLNFAMAARKNH